MKRIHTVTLPNGEIATRTSETKLYSHVVAVLVAPSCWRAASWAGRLDLAQKAASKPTIYAARGAETRVLSVENVREVTPRATKAECGEIDTAGVSIHTTVPAAQPPSAEGSPEDRPCQQAGTLAQS